ncbi:MAG: PTS sugar transporter subunit IIA [Planctomycetota bacterium]
MISLRQAISEGCVLLNLGGRTMPEVVRRAVDFLHETGRITEGQVSLVVDGLLEREAATPTAIGRSVAVPHFYDDAIEEPITLLVRLRRARNLNAPDGVPVRLLFILLGPTGRAAEHIDALAAIARLASDDEFRVEASDAANKDELCRAIDHHVDRFQLRKLKDAHLSPKPEQPRVPFAGLWKDIRRHYPHFFRDLAAGFQPKCLASILFLFFACLAPAITFGGIMGDATGGQIGVEKMLVASAACGVLYALTAGQPLVILGGIGPLLIFTMILYRVCESQDLSAQFLGVYAWVGLWTGGLLVLMGITNASNLMRLFTRFTDEIFSVLMSLIFIYEAGRALIAMFRDSFSVEGGSHDAAFLSLILAIGTFYIASTLAQFRRSHFLLPWMREFLADFGPSIALVAMALLAWFLNTKVPVETLRVDASLSWATISAWRIDLTSVPLWIRWAAIVPAALAAVLIFLTQNITARLINSPENKMQDQDSYHLDLVVVGGMVAGCSYFGLPWLAAATVRSLSHVRALADHEESVGRDGRSHIRVLRVIRNRMTGLLIHALIAVSLLFLEWLNYIPKATLYGIFLFMGVSSLAGVQFMERLGLFVMDSSLYPATHAIRRLPISRIHLYTLVQLICLMVLCVINVIPIQWLQILFPVFIALLVPVRSLLPKLFSRTELAILDADEDPEDEGSHWF